MAEPRAGRQPTISSPGTRRLALQIRRLRRRQPDVDRTIAAIRDGNEHELLTLVVHAQRGDTDSALIAIWALLPRLAAVVINRLPVAEWHQAIDDYVTFAYLTIVDVDPAAPPEFLSDKVIARARRRHERAREPEPATPREHWILQEAVTCDTDLEHRVLARAELGALVQAVRAGLLDDAAWHNLLQVQIERPPGSAATMQQRKALSRARSRLREWRSKAA